MAEGFEGATVDDIARIAGVSKTTLYKYFPDKRSLFAAVAQTACEEQTELAMSFVQDGDDFAAGLVNGCKSFMKFMFSPFGLQMYRTMTSESARFPEFGRQFWATGPEAAHRQLRAVLRDAVAAGTLQITDFELASETLTELCMVHLHSRLLLGVIDHARPDQIDRVARNAVDTFMARFGT